MRMIHWIAVLLLVLSAVACNRPKQKDSLVETAPPGEAGFSTSDQQRVATLILAQRGNLRKVAEALRDPSRAAKILALRLAVIACHDRRPFQLPKWTLRATRAAGYELWLDGDWLGGHPLTQFLLEEEAAQWEKVGVRLSIRPL